MVTKGVYTAERAAALSGVPKSTIYHWARNGVLIPSAWPQKVRLWSFADLMGLRTIYWLRRRKTSEDGVDIPASTMPAVRAALDALQRLERPVWSPGEGSSLLVDGEGRLYIDGAEGLQEPITGQLAMADVLRPVRPFDVAGIEGPDLITPRPSLRIIPGKLGGSPHVAQTRIETRAIAALRDDGMLPERILTFYPELTEQQVVEAIELEEQLKRNLLRAAA